eukprot:6185341-Pleurochrysis_carterae.AAC.1
MEPNEWQMKERRSMLSEMRSVRMNWLTCAHPCAHAHAHALLGTAPLTCAREHAHSRSHTHALTHTHPNPSQPAGCAHNETQGRT